MSNYSQFLDDLDRFYKDLRVKGATPVSSKDALGCVRDQWIAEGKFRELISFVHTNWDSGNCDDFIGPLERTLIETNQVDLFELLWSGIIKYRLAALWRSIKDLKASGEQVVLEEIQSMDISGFDMYSTDSYQDLKYVVAFRRQFAIDGLSRMENGLFQLNQASDFVNEMIDNVSKLRQPSSYATLR